MVAWAGVVAGGRSQLLDVLRMCSLGFTPVSEKYNEKDVQVDSKFLV